MTTALGDTYLDAIAARIGHHAPCAADLLRIYALLALTRGVNTTAEDVHHAWAAWRGNTNPNHPALIPFEDLTPDVQALDEPYADAIRRVAEEIYR